MERIRIRRLTARFAPLLVLLLHLSGCYHLRLVPAPLEKISIVTAKSEREALEAVATVLKDDGFRVEYLPGRACATESREFFVEKGAGQPVEGRHYQYRLKVAVVPAEKGSEVVVEPFSLEIESNYVFDSDGSLATMRKRYPYEMYPGMFDLVSVHREVERVKGLLQRNL